MTDTPTPILTPAQVAEIAARAAIPGFRYLQDADPFFALPNHGRAYPCKYCSGTREKGHTDACPWVHAHDIPELCATVEALRGIEKAQRKRADDLADVRRELDADRFAQARRIEALEAGLREVLRLARSGPSVVRHLNEIEDVAIALLDGCSECHKYAGKCPKCHRQRPKSQEGVPS